MRVTIDGRQIEIHGVHVPNGSSNGWDKTDHLWAFRYGLEGRRLPQILCGDFNTPKFESGREFITFGQNDDGSIQTHTSSNPPYSTERPWNGKEWDAGERAVLDGLPERLGMPDALRTLHPRSQSITWAPYGRPDRGHRLDHVFASNDLVPVRCRHLRSWRMRGMSDHCPIDVTFQVPGVKSP